MTALTAVSDVAGAATVACMADLIVAHARTGRVFRGYVRRWLVRRVGERVDWDILIGQNVASFVLLFVDFNASRVVFLVYCAVRIDDWLSMRWPRIRRRLSRGGAKGRLVLARILARLRPAPARRPGLTPA